MTEGGLDEKGTRGQVESERSSYTQSLPLESRCLGGEASAGGGVGIDLPGLYVREHLVFVAFYFPLISKDNANPVLD